MNLQGGHHGPPGGQHEPPQPPHGPAAAASSGNDPVLSFEDFTAMSPFLDQAALHLASNPYAASASLAAASSGKKNW